MVEIMTGFILFACVVMVVTGSLSALALIYVGLLWIVQAIRGMRAMRAREDRTLDTVARVRARGQA